MVTHRHCVPVCCATRPLWPSPPSHTAISSAINTTTITNRHIAAFNARNLDALLDVLAPNCTVEGLAYSDTIHGKQQLAPFYKALLARVPSDMQLVVDDISGDGGTCVGVTWHLELNGATVPYGRGLSFYRLNARQQVVWVGYQQAVQRTCRTISCVCITINTSSQSDCLHTGQHINTSTHHYTQIVYIRESPEHVAKVPLSSLPIISMAAPLLRALQPLAPGIFARWGDVVVGGGKMYVGCLRGVGGVVVGGVMCVGCVGCVGGGVMCVWGGDGWGDGCVGC